MIYGESSGHNINNNFNTFSDSQISALVITNQVVSGLSILSCLIVVSTYWYFKEIRNFIFNLVMWLCFCNILYCSTSYFPYDNIRDNNKTWCGTQAFMILTFQYASWVLSSLIGYSSFISVIKKDHLERNKCYYGIIFVFVTLIISFSLSSIILFTDTYGPTGGWCWVDVYRNHESKSLIHKLILFYYMATWFFIILNAFFIFKVISILHRNNNRSYSRTVLLKVYHVMKWFPIVQILCIIPSTISRIYNVLDLEANFVLVLAQTIFGSFIGIPYLIIYLNLPQVKECMRVLYDKLFNKVEIETSIDYGSDANSNIYKSWKDTRSNDFGLTKK